MAKKYFLGSVGKAEAFRVVDGNLKLAFVSTTLTDSGLNIQTTKDDIRAGQGAPIQFSFYHDPSVEITLTDVLWNSEYLTAQLGAQFNGEAVDYKTYGKKVEFKANSATATAEIDDIEVLPIPCKGGSQYLVWGAPAGTDNWVDITYENGVLTLPEKVTEDTEYCIRYYGRDSRAKVAEISTQIIPEELYLLITAPIFAGDSCSASKGKPAGHITFEIPRFQLNGAQEFSMNMSSNQTMSLSGIALASASADCDAAGGKLLRVIEVITDRDFKEDIDSIMSDEESQKVGETPKVYAIKKDGTVVLLDNKYLTFNPALDSNGTYATAGDATITLTGTKKSTSVEVASA